MEYVVSHSNGLKATLIRDVNVSIVEAVYLIPQLLNMVSPRGQYWDRYYFYYILMIYLTHLPYFTLFFLQMTRMFFSPTNQLTLYCPL